MNSSEIFNTLDSIGRTASKNEKQAMVAIHAADLEFRRVLVAAYDPFVTYGIAAVPGKAMDSGDDSFTEGGDTWALLDALATRYLTGNAARDAVQEEINRLDSRSALLFGRILTKDLRAGFSESTINKAVKGLIKDFPYMRCCLPKDTDLSSFDWALGVFSQEKADGMFANINHEEGGLVTVTSRQGSPFPIEPFDDIVNDVKVTLMAGHQYHGEIIVYSNGKLLPREQSNGVLNSVLKGGDFGDHEHAVYQIWDCIPLDKVVTKGKFDLTYRNRLAGIMKMLKPLPGNGFIELIPTRIVHSLADAYKHYSELVKSGKEGSVIKDPHAPWRDGTSKHQVKLKMEVDVDLEIVKFLPGTGKNAETFGSILCKTSDGLLEVAVTGFADAHRKAINEKSLYFVGTIMTVKANAIMYPSKDGGLHSLFLPRWVEFRQDKTEADSLERVFAQFNSAVKAA